MSCPAPTATCGTGSTDRPTSGPHPIVAYFHGGGWVLGSHESDDPFCRDLCVAVRRDRRSRSTTGMRPSTSSRPPPTTPSPLCGWIADHAAELGGIPGQLAVAGWSAGGNVATVAARMARDAGGPEIVGQLLDQPGHRQRHGPSPSYRECAEGYVLTKALMEWFFDHYMDGADRTDPRVSPLRARDLSGLPPAVIVTSEFDPAAATRAPPTPMPCTTAGVATRHVFARGHTHTSLTMVDVVLSGAPVRAEMGDALRGFFKASVPA